MRRARKKPRKIVEIAKDRINILFNKAKKEAEDGNLELARDLIGEARKIAQKVNIRIPREYSKSYCRKCNSYLIPGKSSIVRLDSKKKTITIVCLHCGSKRRYSYNNKTSKNHKEK